MTTPSDLLYVVLFAIVVPALDYLAFWPAYHRLARTEPAWARRWLWTSTIGSQWTLVAFGTALWLAHERSWDSFGFTVPNGWRLWAAIALVVLLVAYHAWAVVTLVHSAAARASMRQQVGPVTAVVPHTGSELYWFGGVSLTAGFCEEFLFRGYFIWAFAPWLGWWGAAALSLSLFALWHFYQGWGGVLRCALAGAFFTLIVALFDSLWPAIAIHAVVDLCGGLMAWLALREESVSRDEVAAGQLTQ